MKPITVIDAETDPFGAVDYPQPFIWGFYDGSLYKTFETEESLIEFLYPRDITVYAHNGGKFDFHFLLDFIPEGESISVINGRLVKFRIGNCEFRDSYPILQSPLSAFSKLDIDYDKMRKEVRHLHMEEIKQYLQYDCVSLYNVTTKFIDTYGKHLTLPSSAINQLKKIEEIELPKQSTSMDEYLRDYYYGGRTQVFEYGLINESVTLIDINSAYPYAMEFNHPFSETAEIIEHNKKIKSSEVIEQSFYTIKAKTKTIGPFPVRKENGGIDFPITDQLTEFHVTGWELKTAIDNELCYELKVVTETRFNETRNFSTFVQKFWEQKLNSEKGSYEYIFAKLMLNSAYGKFASNPRKYKEYKFIDINKLSKYMDFCECGNNEKCTDEKCEKSFDFERDFLYTALVSKKLPREKWRFFNVAVGASITGFARAYLLKGLLDVLKDGGKILYCDTDSIFFSGNCIFDNIGPDLGQWEVEGLFPRGGAIAGKKLYCFEYGNGKFKVASKGTKLNEKDIKILAADKTAKIKYSFEAPVYTLTKKPYKLTREIRST